MRRIVTAGLGLAGGFVLATNFVVPSDGSSAQVYLSTRHGDTESPSTVVVPSRSTQLDRLKAASQETQTPFNVIVIGGGATGSGCALDATTRGLKTLLVESEDFAAGTSSRSTKLVHGGVRYLEKAVKNLDYGQLKLVFEALHERKTVLDIAPHLASTLPIMTPCYSWWEVPYYWAGLKAYDLVAGSRALAWSHFVPPSRAAAAFPTLCKLRKDGASLKGTVRPVVLLSPF
jgi:glycerol-3-phosphate dehydrogenase